jgi:hypothetical protein
MSPEVVSYSLRSIINQMIGNNEKAKELQRKAIEFNKQEDKLVTCKYWHTGQKIDADICFETRVITSTTGEVLRRKILC